MLSNKEIDDIISGLGVSDIEKDKRDNTIFRVGGTWYLLNSLGEIEKYSGKKALPAEYSKKIKEEIKKLKPGLKWYFKVFK